jgi:hypothetical protein
VANIDSEADGLLRICMMLDPAWCFTWHLWLFDELSAKGHQIEVCLRGDAGPAPPTLRLLLQLEKLVLRRGIGGACNITSPDNFKNVENGAPLHVNGYDLVIDLAGCSELQQFRCRSLRPLYDNRAGLYPLVDIIIEGRSPQLSIADSALGAPRRIGLPAISRRRTMIENMGNVCARMLEAIIKIVDEISGHNLQLPSIMPAARNGVASAGGRVPMTIGRFFVANMSLRLAGRINDIIRNRAGHDIRWGVGWRHTHERSVSSGQNLDISNFVLLRDDMKRSYATPFAIVHEGVKHVFVSEYSFAAQKSVIAHFTISADGQASRPQMVLSRPGNLSYPYLFRHGGEIFMTPSSPEGKKLELYRAAHFPDRWVLEKKLLDGICIDNATLTWHEGKIWMFAAAGRHYGSLHDGLGLFHANDLMGEWSAHPLNPVIVDVGAARPAGSMFRHEGALWRPVHDCSAAHGAGLAFFQVTKLSEEEFEQERKFLFAPNGANKITDMQTVNYVQGMEVADFFGRL